MPVRLWMDPKVTTAPQRKSSLLLQHLYNTSALPVWTPFDHKNSSCLCRCTGQRCTVFMWCSSCVQTRGAELRKFESKTCRAISSWTAWRAPSLFQLLSISPGLHRWCLTNGSSRLGMWPLWSLGLGSLRAVYTSRRKPKCQFDDLLHTLVTAI